MQDSAGNTASYQYDADGNMLKLTDAKGSQTQWSYDASNRAIRKTYADQHYQAYTYNGGLLSATQNEKGQITNYQYDDDSKLTTIDYPTMADVSFGYDGLDRLTNMTDGMGTTNYSYDNLDQLSSENGPWTNDTLNFAYDSLGRETGIGLNGTTVSTYGYDDLSRLSGLNSIAGNFAYSYVGNSGSLNQIDMPNGAKSTFTYDALQRLTQVQSLTSGSVNIAKFAYTLDNRDIRISIEKTFGADPMRHVNYGYDTVNQLTSAVSTETPPAVNQQWSYDPMGNRTQHVSTPGANPTSTATYTSNGLNQISHITNVAASITTENAFTYDADGNTTQVANANATTQYTYDDADRLSSVVFKNGSGVNLSKSTYAYDGLDRLRIITKFTWDTPTSAWVQQSQKKMLYDGMQVIQERDGSDNILATDIWDGNIGGLEARVVYDVATPTNPPQKYFYHYDGSGNVSAVTDDSQTTVASYDYDAYGNLMSSSGAYASQNPWRFSTKYYDDGSGLYYYGYRFYSPGLGKWINRDPIAESGGLNLYGFVGNNPINNPDEYGLVASVVINPGNKITVYVPIEYKGKGASHAVTEAFDRGIERWWSGKFGKNTKYTVTTKVVHKNFVKGQDHWNVINIQDCAGRSYINMPGRDSGVWYDEPIYPGSVADALGWTAAHETGHLMGLPDQYDDVGNVSVPKHGFSGNIMAQPYGHVGGFDITNIINYSGNKIIK